LSLGKAGLVTIPLCGLLLLDKSAQTTDKLIVLLNKSLLFLGLVWVSRDSLWISGLDYWLNQTRRNHHIFRHLIFDFKFLLLSEVVHEDV
jgi:hypothetical protein